MTVIVCPAPSLADVCRRFRPSRVLTLVSPGDAVPVMPGGAERLVLTFNDIADPRAGLVAPDAAAIVAILAFGRGWAGPQPLVAQCGAGVSRATAAAFVLACDRHPEIPEREIAAALRAASPTATPNPLMVRLADDRLDRRGRMVAAATAIGRGSDWAPYGWFRLEVACPAPA